MGLPFPTSLLLVLTDFLNNFPNQAVFAPPLHETGNYLYRIFLIFYIVPRCFYRCFLKIVKIAINSKNSLLRNGLPPFISAINLGAPCLIAARRDPQSWTKSWHFKKKQSQACLFSWAALTSAQMCCDPINSWGIPANRTFWVTHCRAGAVLTDCWDAGR